MIHDEMIEILAAHRDGRRIQVRRLVLDETPELCLWHDYPSDEEGGNPPCDWTNMDYRIKPGTVCKTRIQVHGFPIYVEGGPQTARVLEDSYAEYWSSISGVTELKALDKEPREEFELKPV